MLAYITGTVDQELLLRNEYLVAENRILRAQIQGRQQFSDSEKAALAEIAHRLGRKALADVASAAKPDTLLGWYRKLIAKKFEGSRLRKSRGRPRTDQRALRHYEIHYHQERNHQGKNNLLLFPSSPKRLGQGKVRCQPQSPLKAPSLADRAANSTISASSSPILTQSDTHVGTKPQSGQHTLA